MTPRRNDTPLVLLGVLSLFIFCIPFSGADEPERDPFQARIEAPKPKPAAQMTKTVQARTDLQGISAGPKGAFAIIGGETYREGEEKDGIKVLKIRKREVDIVMSNGVIETLRMVPAAGASSDAEVAEASKAKSSGRINCGPLEECV